MGLKCMDVLSAWASAHQKRALMSYSCELPRWGRLCGGRYGTLDLNSASLENQPGLLTEEPCLQAPKVNFDKAFCVSGLSHNLSDSCHFLSRPRLSGKPDRSYWDLK